MKMKFFIVLCSLFCFLNVANAVPVRYEITGTVGGTHKGLIKLGLSDELTFRGEFKWDSDSVIDPLEELDFLGIHRYNSDIPILQIGLDTDNLNTCILSDNVGIFPFLSDAMIFTTRSTDEDGDGVVDRTGSEILGSGIFYENNFVNNQVFNVFQPGSFEISTESLVGQTFGGDMEDIDGLSIGSVDFTITSARLADPVPEPTTIVLFGIGLLGLTGIGRRKK